MSNQIYLERLQTATRQITDGGGFADAVRATQLMPLMAARMIEVGETSGGLDGMKKSAVDLRASKIAAENPGAEVRVRAVPQRAPGASRPFAVTYYIVKDGKVVEAVSVLDK